MRPKPGIAARAEIQDIIDGDTLDVVLKIPVRIRLLDCWAPETRGHEAPEGKRSKEALDRLIDGRDAALVHIPTEDAHKFGDVLTFGRVLGNVWIGEDQESLSEKMVAEGFAKAKKDA
ncbi:MAG: hypothetical protein CMK32_08120 [Porticoccaceae bacterium]|nr:hypothetical protein [Porticoccaceae bacterium]